MKEIRNFEIFLILKSQYFSGAHTGQTEERYSLNRQKENGMMEGYTDNYIKVTTPPSKRMAEQYYRLKLYGLFPAALRNKYPANPANAEVTSTENFAAVL